jgi:hypothetical protein
VPLQLLRLILLPFSLGFGILRSQLVQLTLYSSILILQTQRSNVKAGLAYIPIAALTSPKRRLLTNPNITHNVTSSSNVYAFSISQHGRVGKRMKMAPRLVNVKLMSFDVLLYRRTVQFCPNTKTRKQEFLALAG